MCRAATTSSCARERTRDCGCLSLGANDAAHNAHVCYHTDVTQMLILASQIWEPTGVPHLCRAAATSSYARERTRDCGCLSFGAEVVTHIAHICDHTDVTQNLILASQVWEPPWIPHLCRAPATRSCARGRTRECGGQALGAEVAARSGHACDHTNVTLALNLAFQFWVPPEVPHLCRAVATSSYARRRTGVDVKRLAMKSWFAVITLVTSQASHKV